MWRDKGRCVCVCACVYEMKRNRYITRIMFIWTLVWKNSQSCGPTSSQTFPIFCNLSSSSKVVLAWRKHTHTNSYALSESYCMFTGHLNLSTGMHNDTKIDSAMFQLIKTKTTVQMEKYKCSLDTHNWIEAHGMLLGSSQIMLENMLFSFCTNLWSLSAVVIKEKEGSFKFICQFKFSHNLLNWLIRIQVFSMEVSDFCPLLWYTFKCVGSVQSLYYQSLIFIQ